MKKQIITNLFSNYFSNFMGMFLGFMLVPFLLKHLGKDAFGLIVLAESTIAFFEIATVSIRIALSRYATFALAQGRRDDFIAFLSTGRVILLFSAALVILTGSLCSYYFPSIFRVPVNLTEDSKILFFLITVAFTISIPNSVYWSVLYSKHRFDLINLSYSSGVILKAVSIFILFSILPARFLNLTLYGAIYLAMTWAQNFAIYLWNKSVMPGIQLAYGNARRSYMREILGFSAYSALGRASTLLYQNTANVLVNLFWGAGANAIYSVGLKFPQILSRLFEEATYSLTSSFNEMVARNDRAQLKAVFFSYTKVLTAATSPICIALILFSSPLIELWVGPQFEDSARLMPILLFPLILKLPVSVCGCVLTSYGEVRLPSVVGTAFAVVNVILGIVLGKGLGQGLFGIAWAASATTVLYSLAFTPYYTCRVARISSGQYLREALALPGAWALAVLGAPAYFLLRLNWYWPKVLGIEAALFPIYACGFFAFILNADERRNLMQLLQSVQYAFRTRKQGYAPRTPQTTKLKPASELKSLAS